MLDHVLHDLLGPPEHAGRADRLRQQCGELPLRLLGPPVTNQFGAAKRGGGLGRVNAESSAKAPGSLNALERLLIGGAGCLLKRFGQARGFAGRKLQGLAKIANVIRQPAKVGTAGQPLVKPLGSFQ
ncbi:MAG: hypothetical protein MUF20_03190 [Methylotetracoccus sp.]|nr:hypothetical protein [Methylotetracoccus sp.]